MIEDNHYIVYQPNYHPAREQEAAEACRANEQHDGVEYTMSLPAHVKIGGRTAERGLENLLDATYPDITNPQPRPPVYFTERTILTTCNETVDELNHSILGKFSGVTCTFAGYNKVVH